MQEEAREAVNTALLSLTDSADCSSGSNMNAQGVIDFASAVSSDGSATDAGSSTVKAADLTGQNPSDQYYTDLANAFVTDLTNSCMVSTVPH